MTSRKGKARERQLARDKYERQLARRAASARRRRQVKAGVGVLVLVLAGFAVAWFLGAFDSDEKDKGKDPKDEPSTSVSDTSSPSDDPSKSDDKSDKPSDDKSSSDGEK